MNSFRSIDNMKYKGKYVALKSFSDSTIVAVGNKPEKVMAAAKKTGVEEPVIVYIPKRDMAYVY